MASVPVTLPVWMQQQPDAASVPSNKDVALALTRMGIRVFPCNAERHPTVKAWEQAATSDASKIDGWRTAYLPAIPPGVQGLVVIDCDRHKQGEDGLAAFHALCTQNSISLESAFAVETPNNGRHYYFATRTPYSNSDDLLPDGVNVRGVGGYVMAPGATLTDGRGYRIVSGDWSRIPALPPALAAFLQEKRPVAPPQATTGQGPVLSADDLAYFTMPFEAERAKLRALTTGRNVALMHIAKFAGNYMHYGLDRRQIEADLYADSVANGYVAARGASVARKTISHNIEDGMSKPCELPKDRAARLSVGVDLSAVLSTATVNAQPAIGTKLPEQGQTVLLGGKDIVPRSVDWLWKGYLPNGMLTMFAGLGGTGKSTIACSFAATVTTGGVWPDGTRCSKPGHVLFWSSEETPEYSIAPRMMAMGANAERYSIIQGTREDGSTVRQFDAARDMASLKAAVQSIGGVSLLIIDPILSAVVGDTNKATDVRRSLQPIVDFAEECKCAVLCISHFAKGTAGRRPEERTLGSSAYKDLPRMVLSAGQEEGSPHCVFTRTKSNISATGGGFSYTLEQYAFPYGIDHVETTRIAWGEALEGSARSILAEVEEATEDDGSAVSKARQLFLNLLAQGPRYATDVQAAAKELNISSASLRRAREALKIVIERDKGFHAKVRWSLPFDPNAIAQIGGAPIGQRVGGIPWEQVQ